MLEKDSTTLLSNIEKELSILNVKIENIEENIKKSDLLLEEIKRDKEKLLREFNNSKHF